MMILVARFKWLCCVSVFVFPVAQFCFAQNNAIHTMFLQQALPANGVQVDFNAPVLRWPYQKGKQVRYDVQLSQDSLFNAGTTITAEGLRSAIYNPHTTLQNGTWFWHYKVEGKPWSQLMQFEVTENALPMPSTTAAVFLSKVPAHHPRILLNDPADDIKKLAGTTDALVIISEAEIALKEKTPTEAEVKPAATGTNEQQQKKILADAIVRLGNQVNQMIEPLCQAYLLTSNKAYMAKAVELAMEVANWDPEGVSGSRDFTDGICMYDMALVFDTFYDELSADQKNKLQKAAAIRAAKFYKSWVNNIDSKVLSGHVWQLLLNEFFKTSLALYDHQPEAAEWLAYAYELFLARAPVLGGIDGGWAEGASYFTMNMETLTDIPNKIKLYTGFDFIRHHPWYTNNANWMIYHFPPASSPDGFGDNTNELFMPPVSYAAFALAMAQLTNNQKYSWYANKLIQEQKMDLSHEPTMRWTRLINNYQLLPGTGEGLEFPMAQLSKEAGIAAIHTDITNTKKDLAVTMRSSPFGAYGHILADQNTFNILYGGQRLFYRTGYKVSMDDPHRQGWSKHTKSQNGVLINGEGQPYTAEAYGNFSRFLQGRQMAYLKGDASNAYRSVESKEDFGVTKFYRHLLVLKPNIIVIYDELDARAPAQWSWLIHSLENMELDTTQNKFISTIANAKGIGKLWSSQPFSWRITDKFEVPAVIFRNYKGMKIKKFDDSQWHVRAINNDSATSIRFFTIIQVATDGKQQSFKEMPVKNGLVKIAIAGWQITAALSTGLAPQLDIIADNGGTAFTAYQSSVQLNNKTYDGKIAGSSKLAEIVNGNLRFVEMADEPVRPLR